MLREDEKGNATYRFNVPNEDYTWEMGLQRIAWCEEFWNFKTLRKGIVKNINMDAVFIVLYFSEPQSREAIHKDRHKTNLE